MSFWSDILLYNLRNKKIVAEAAEPIPLLGKIDTGYYFGLVPETDGTDFCTFTPKLNGRVLVSVTASCSGVHTADYKNSVYVYIKDDKGYLSKNIGSYGRTGGGGVISEHIDIKAGRTYTIYAKTSDDGYNYNYSIDSVRVVGDVTYSENEKLDWFSSTKLQ